jgi:hypothetical protein
MYNLEVIINGKQFNNNLPLRQILVTMTNAIFGITGIITMASLPKINIICYQIFYFSAQLGPIGGLHGT